MEVLIDASKLQLSDTPKLISSQALSLLKDKKIKLSLDVYDSHINNRDISKPVLVCLHGNSMSKDLFLTEEVKKFTEIYRVIAIDLPGHGQSTHISSLDKLSQNEKELISSDFYNPCSMIACLSQVLKKLQLNNIHLLGWSLGGHMAYGIATEIPEMIASITTIASPPVFFPSSEGVRRGFNALFLEEIIPNWIANPQKLTLEWITKFSAPYSGYTEPEGKDKIFVAANLRSDPLMRKYLFLDMDKNISKALDGEHFIKTSSLPLCLLKGGDDEFTGPDLYQNESTIFINGGKFIHTASRVITIPHAMHAPFRTHPEAFFKVLSQFITGLEPRQIK